MEIFKKIKNSKFFKIVSNLYILISVVFFIWIFFIDSNSILVNIKLNKEISELKERKDILENQIQIDKKIISNLQNPDSLEKYAREKLYMKKENEEIFIIELKNSLKRHERVELRDVFSMEPRLYKARTARNPKTKEKVYINEKYSIVFKTSKMWSKKINDEK